MSDVRLLPAPPELVFDQGEWAERLATQLDKIAAEVGPLRQLLVVEGVYLARMYRAARAEYRLEVGA